MIHPYCERFLYNWLTIFCAQPGAIAHHSDANFIKRLNLQKNNSINLHGNFFNFENSITIALAPRPDGRSTYHVSELNFAVFRRRYKYGRVLKISSFDFFRI